MKTARLTQEPGCLFSLCQDFSLCQNDLASHHLADGAVAHADNLQALCSLGGAAAVDF